MTRADRAVARAPQVTAEQAPARQVNLDRLDRLNDEPHYTINFFESIGRFGSIDSSDSLGSLDFFRPQIRLGAHYRDLDGRAAERPRALLLL